MLTTTLRRNEHTATASQTTFTYNFRIFASTDLVVYVNGTLISAGNYTVTGVGDLAGGTVVFTAGRTVGDEVVIVDVRTPLQEDDLLTGGRIRAEHIELTLDKLAAGIQQTLERVSRSLQLNVAHSHGRLTPVLPVPDNLDVAEATNRWALVWRTDGANLELFELSTETGLLSSALQTSTKAALPPGAAEGSARLVTNDVGGIWQKSSSQWWALTGSYADVRALGCVGDGATDDRTALATIQAGLPAGTGLRFPGPYTYLIGSSLTITVPCQFHPGARLRPAGTITTGTHTGSNNSATLVDTTKNFTTAGVTVGAAVLNTTDGSRGIVSAISTTTNPNDTLTLSPVLNGGAQNDFDTGDSYTIVVAITFASTAPIEAGPYTLFDLSLGGLVTFAEGRKAHVNWWGALADNSTDCATAFNNAMRAVTTNMQLEASQGIYKLGSKVTFPQGTVRGWTLKGAGKYATTFARTTGYVGILFETGAGSPTSNVWQLEDCTLDGLNSTASTIGIRSFRAGRSEMRRVYVKNWDVGVWVSGSSYHTVEACDFDTNLTYGMTVDNTDSAAPTHGRLEDCRFRANGTASLNYDGSVSTGLVRLFHHYRCSFEHDPLDTDDFFPGYVAGSDIGVRIDQAEQLHFHGCWWEDCSRHIVTIGGEVNRPLRFLTWQGCNFGVQNAAAAGDVVEFNGGGTNDGLGCVFKECLITDGNWNFQQTRRVKLDNIDPQGSATFEGKFWRTGTATISSVDTFLNVVAGEEVEQTWCVERYIIQEASATWEVMRFLISQIETTATTFTLLTLGTQLEEVITYQASVIVRSATANHASDLFIKSTWRNPDDVAAVIVGEPMYLVNGATQIAATPHTLEIAQTTEANSITVDNAGVNVRLRATQATAASRRWFADVIVRRLRSVS